MASALDHEMERAVDLRAHVVALDRKLRKAGGNIDDRERLGRRLDCRRGGADLDGESAIGRARDLGFELAQFGRGEAHLAGQRLTMDERPIERRSQQFLAVLGGHLDEIAEHVVVPNFQTAHARGFGVARLQRRDDPTRFVAQRTRFVERNVITRAHEAAVAFEMGQLVGQRRGKFVGDCTVESVQSTRGMREFGGNLLCFLQLGRDRRGDNNAVANGGEIARAATADDEARQRAGEVGRRLQTRA